MALAQHMKALAVLNENVFKVAWLQKRPQVSDGIQLYSTSLGKTLLLVGLGNPGEAYELTRHNTGFIALDAFVESTDEMSDWGLKKDLKAYMSTGRLGETKVIAIKPTTFMNDSGQAVQAAKAFYKITSEHIAVIHDELDIEFGQIRLRGSGSSAGNNGIKSVSQHIGEDYGRIRVGIGPKKPAQMDTVDFVLQKFTAAQQKQLPNLCRETNAILSEYIYGGQLPHETRSFIV